ncbi:hypothetical protein GCM10008959_29810 [Deinococcus seoulensis]|uniref:Uncharacterized protein n=2 Tax=Deinococcus seoulensis TaxID=1837379 RepID=A0ABQ2RTY8_9DEIO|nr:hypothetical protein GCM10008959_29810 [Deinococcus seoulensis]
MPVVKGSGLEAAGPLRYAARMRPPLRSGRFRSLPVTLGAALLVTSAQAATLDFGVSYRAPDAGLWGRVGVSDLDLLGGQVSAALSSRAAQVGYARSLSLPPLGAATARTDLAVTWQGGVRVDSRASAGVGPVALNLAGAYFTAPVTDVDPLAPFAQAPADLRGRGWNASLIARYRVNRTLIAVLGGELGAQPQLSVGVEGRRVLTRPVTVEPEPAEPDLTAATEPAAPEAAADPADAAADTPDTGPLGMDDTLPDTEPVGTLTWRAGALAGRDVLGLTGGVSYATENGLSVGVDALAGLNSFGVTGSLSAPDLLGDGSSVRLYAAYEPWRTVSAPLRTGVNASLPAGSGTLTLDASAGRTLQGQAGFGVRVGYTLPLP